MTALLGLDRPALLDAHVAVVFEIRTVGCADPLRRAELAGRCDVIEGLLGQRDLQSVVAEYRPLYRPDPLWSEDSLVCRQQASSFGALEAYLEFTEGVPDATRCAYEGCGARLIPGVDDVLAGSGDDVFCADGRGCLSEHALDRAMALSWSRR